MWSRNLLQWCRKELIIMVIIIASLIYIYTYKYYIAIRILSMDAFHLIKFAQHLLLQIKVLRVYIYEMFLTLVSYYQAPLYEFIISFCKVRQLTNISIYTKAKVVFWYILFIYMIYVWLILPQSCRKKLHSYT